MGGYSSRDLGQREHVAERLQECFNDHGNNLKAIEQTIKTQNLAVDLLTKFESTKQPNSTEQYEEDEENRNRTILSNIQGILMLQSNIVKTNFKHLKLCLLDAVKQVAAEKDLTPKWNKLVDELSNNDCLDTPLCKYSTEKLDEVTDSVKTTRSRQDRKEDEYKSKKEEEFYDKRRQKILDAKDEEIKELERNLDSYYKHYQKTLDAKEEEIKKLRSKELTCKNSHLKSLNELQVENNRLNDEYRSVQRRNQYLEDEMIKKVKPKVPLQLYYLRNDDLMMTVVHELFAMLNTQMSLQNVEVDIQHRTQASDIQPDIPVLALCINASRLGTDAASAIHGLRSTHQIALLIFHHKDMHAVPTQKSERMLTGQEFKDLGGIFDLVFLRGKGIYACDLNNEALRSIARFMKG